MPGNDRLLYVVMDTPDLPNFSALYRRLGYEELRLPSQRKAIGALKKSPPAVVVGAFVDAFHTYYQATNISNLDVLLQSLTKYAPEARVVVIADRRDLQKARRLQALHPHLTVLSRPVSEGELEQALSAVPPSPR